MKRRIGLALLVAAVTAGVAFAQAPPVSVTKTVGTAAGVCANSTLVVVPPGLANVTYCYTISNAGGGNATYTLTDDKLGLIAANQTVGPFGTVQLLRSTTVNGSITNVANLTVFGIPVGTAAAQVTMGADVPTLTDLGLVALGLALAAAGVVVMRYRAI
jgi:hypothetical protein